MKNANSIEENLLGNKNPKEKLIERIMRENIKYEERFDKSLTNQYTCTIIYKNGSYKKGACITAPKYTDDTILEQAYSLAHELGHYNVNMKLLSINNIFIENINERKAWKEAENICNEENISIEGEFYSLKERCLNTYTEGVKKSIKNGFAFIFDIIKSYYIILISLHLIYKCVNDGMVDLFGVLKYFNEIDIDTVTNLTWLTYNMLRIFKRVYVKLKLDIEGKG